MPQTRVFSLATIPRDLTAGLIVFLVALPLCLGVALASNAPLFSGILAGIVGGIIVGSLSGSHASVTGPAAGLTAIVAQQIALLGSFEAFLLAVVVGGAIQIVLGVVRAGFIAAFFPTSVIKGLLSAIGVILILKQIPHLLGHDTDPEGEMAFFQPDSQNTISELFAVVGDLHVGAATIGIVSLVLLYVWDKTRLSQSRVPAPLVIVLGGVAARAAFESLGAPWAIEASHLVQVPIATRLAEVGNFLTFPDWARWTDPTIYTAGLVLAVVATLETLLNLEAIEKLDPRKRVAPANRELIAQGLGNICAGLIGGIPVTSVIVRSSVNINAGGQTKLSTIVHGGLLLSCALLLPQYLNQIPLACLAAVLLHTGAKLVSPAVIREMWNGGRYQFMPFLITVVAIVFTDLVRGVLIGLAVSVSFILYSNMKRPLRRIVERHLGGEILRIELANQVSFLNRAVIDSTLDQLKRGDHVLLDARHTVYIDPDVLAMIRDFTEHSAPARGVKVSLLGFRERYHIKDQIEYVEFATRELQGRISPMQVLEVLSEGNRRFRTGNRLTRDLGHELRATAEGQHPLAVVLSCIDSRTPIELIFDLGLGDILSVRVAGNIISPKVLGSIEYSCAVAGAKLVLVMGHTRCGAVNAAVSFAGSSESVYEVTGCEHLDHVVNDILHAIDPDQLAKIPAMSPSEREAYADEVARENVRSVVRAIPASSQTLDKLLRSGRIAIVGAMYNVSTGMIEFLDQVPRGAVSDDQPRASVAE
ncbi:MAG: bifunctional SulP family inorganic anion transporter/carbonic anhydrase [Planctomycetaceae bacterium]|nr:bifunctional SulP family inorganic anion transporter/carbonic anhydrase [Planctomycetaceae bacterium]